MDGQKISAKDLPQAIRSEDEPAPEPAPRPPLVTSRLTQRLPSLVTTAVSLLAVGALATSAAREISTPLPSPAKDVPPIQTVGTNEVSPAEVAEIDPPRGESRRRGAARSRRAPRNKGKARHVTLTFGAPQGGSGGANSTSSPPSSGYSAPASGGNDEKKPRRKPGKVREVEAEFAIPTSELIHIHKIGTTEHFFSTDRAECERRYESGYIYKGVMGMVFDQQVEGTVPLRTDDGIAAYIWSSGGENGLPVHYLRSPRDQDRDFFTVNEADRQDFAERGWIYLGVVGYVSAR